MLGWISAGDHLAAESKIENTPDQGDIAVDGGRGQTVSGQALLKGDDIRNAGDGVEEAMSP